MGPELLVWIVAVVLGYKLIARQMEIKRIAAEARQGDGRNSDMAEVREELAEIREMLADVLLDDHARRARPLPQDLGRDAPSDR
ncbi:hypothetical protein CMK11_20105 [Candidatus Poribacteria bacterium]|nr:hypothetical protein [Candidatus Poribacteria bacterium]